MRLLYKNICFQIAFSAPMDFPFPPAFVFRSVIGYHLRKMCCVDESRQCASCLLHVSCVYCRVFESVVAKTNRCLPGRDRVPHPVVLDSPLLAARQAREMDLNMIFIGDALRFLPYVYRALLESGVDGLLKARTTFSVKDVRSGNRSLLAGGEGLAAENLSPDLWEFDAADESRCAKSFVITLVTPLRFKARGHYSHDFSAADFMLCLHRRARTLCAAYGDVGNSGEPYVYQDRLTITERSLVWQDYHHYSGRQGKAMRLGGVLGRMRLAGEFTAYEAALLDFAAIFHAGKNTNFGLGKIVNSGGKEGYYEV